jgi:hypothetical protein
MSSDAQVIVIFGLVFLPVLGGPEIAIWPALAGQAVVAPQSIILSGFSSGNS